MGGNGKEVGKEITNKYGNTINTAHRAIKNSFPKQTFTSLKSVIQ